MVSQKGFAHILLLILLLAGLAAGVYLVQTKTNWLPKASETNITKEVWFTPNFGSIDMLQLFSNPEQWADARSKINVFKFYTQWLTLHTSTDCPGCGPNLMPNLINAGVFSKLNSWNIAIAFEAGVIKPGACTEAAAKNNVQAHLDVIKAIQSNGGTVRYIAMDEPYIGGTAKDAPNSCNFSMEEAALKTAQYINSIKQSYPDVETGDIEPYPYFSAYELKKWISELEKDNIKPAFFHLDINMDLVTAKGTNLAADLQDLKAFTESKGIPFGVIFIGDWPDENQHSDRSYYESTLALIGTVKSAIGLPAHSIFQSWVSYPPGEEFRIPGNLPENDDNVYSHTRLINDGYQILSSGGFLDGVDNNTCMAGGWTCDGDDNNASLDVHFYIDHPAGEGVYANGSVKANQRRDDLVAAGACGRTANHGFTYNLPDAVKDGKPHTLYAYSINIGPNGANSLLPGSPKTFVCGGPAPTATPTPPSTSAVAPVGRAVPLFRFRNNGLYLYTFDPQEKEEVLQKGWIDEGNAGYVYDSQVSGTVPIYRFLNPQNGDHFYTSNEQEKDQVKSGGWSYEGIAGYILSSESENSVPLYRLHNKGIHFYTANKEERDNAIQNLGFEDEGILGYVLTRP